MISRTVSLPPPPLAPAPLGIRWPLGVPLDLQISFRNIANEKIDMTGALHQLMLFPRSRGGQQPYDMSVYDAVNGIMAVTVPGGDLGDDKGYNIEIYSRTANPVPGDAPKPTFMPVTGSIVTYGTGYGLTKQTVIVNFPTIVGPPGDPGDPGGPPGPAGAAGQRGSIWFAGSGAPTVSDGVQTGDMYLDESNGDVWRYNGATWARGSFG